jgi:8-oxo-dGTP diphosphatase
VTSAHHRVVAGALRKDGRVLLCHRSSTRTWYPNVWDLPGAEGAEDERDALVRELAEELGVRVQKPTESPFAKLIAEGVRGEPGVELAVWAVDAWDGAVVNQSPGEHDKLGWFSPTELGDLDLAHPSYVAILSTLLAGAASMDQ